MPRRPAPPADGWEESTEGDRDVDLTEETGYASWDPPRRSWGPLVLKVGLTLALLGMIAGTILPLLSR